MPLLREVFVSKSLWFESTNPQQEETLAELNKRNIIKHSIIEMNSTISSSWALAFFGGKLYFKVTFNPPWDGRPCPP